MQYDPIKKRLGAFFNRSPFLRKCFYHLLDLLLLRSWHVARELRGVRKDLPEKPHILDAGSGFGQYVFRMSRIFKGASIVGVDVKEEQIADCNAFFNQIRLSNQVRFEEGDLTRYCKPGSFDLILSVDVMEHIADDTMVFKNFFTSLHPGGWLILSTPSDQGGSEAHNHETDPNPIGFIDEHVRDGYNLQDICQKLKDVGFSAVSARYSYGTPGKISWKLSMKYPIVALNASKLFFLILPFYYIIAYPIAFFLNIFDVNGAHHSGTGLIIKAQKEH